MKKKSFPLFYTIYFAVLFVFMAALFVGLYFLRTYLSDYEASQPKYKMEEVVQQYFKVDDKSHLLAKSNYKVPKYSSVFDVVSYLDEAIDEEGLNYYSVSSNDDNTVSYAVTSKDLKIATVNLVGADNDKGFKEYSLDSIELTIGGADAVRVKAPLGYTVYINNVPLTEENETGDREESLGAGHMYGDVSAVSYVTYKVDGLFSKPAVTAKDNNGTSVSGITSDENGVIYTVPLVYREVTDNFRKNVLEAAEAYAAYMQNDVAFTKVAKYVDKNSNLYTNLRTSDIRWVNDHNGYSIDNPDVSELYYYDDNTYSCRVRFVHTLHRKGAPDYNNAFDMTFYYRKVGSKFLIYDSQVN